MAEDDKKTATPTKEVAAPKDATAAVGTIRNEPQADVGGVVNKAPSPQDDADFADRAVDEGSLPQITLDEMNAGRAALERRNGKAGKGRRLDAADAADKQAQQRSKNA